MEIGRGGGMRERKRQKKIHPNLLVFIGVRETFFLDSCHIQHVSGWKCLFNAFEFTLESRKKQMNEIFFTATEPDTK